MLMRRSMFALQAIAFLGATALVSPSASAMRAPVGNHGGAHPGGESHGMRGGGGEKFTPHNPGSNSGNLGSTSRFQHFGQMRDHDRDPRDHDPRDPRDHDPRDHDPRDHDHDHDHDRDRDHDRDWDRDHDRYSFWWHRPHYGVVEYNTVGAVGAAVTTGPAAPCNCLTKRYLDDGSVLFTDICTKEQAMATPDELKAQAQGAAPQAR
jgi:hypothetical protein